MVEVLLVWQLEGTPSAPRCPSPPGSSPGRRGIPWTTLPAPPDGAMRASPSGNEDRQGGFMESFTGVSCKPETGRGAAGGESGQHRGLAFSPANVTGGRGHGYLARVLIWRGLGQVLGGLAGVQHSAFRRAAASRRLPAPALRGKQRACPACGKRHVSEKPRSDPEPEPRSGARGRQGERRDPQGFTPVGHAPRCSPTATGARRARTGRGEAPRRNRGRRTGEGGGERGTDDDGGPCVSAGPSPSPPRALGSASRQPPTPPARCGRAT